ncbi:Re/Si-specific NAD(P)(+) transhydrogenase subunit alpha [Caulobacter sp. DWR2-3-1b2]|uniref:Re/Si-specific NAD(P)(+) transhydrogenase subunit alpha n=1 Tax=unclassified Caulobacter TaxID=2648921 RepID=UPI003CEAC482
MPVAIIAVTKETRGGETRVAATPETVKKLAAAGWTVVVEAGAGAAAAYPDADYAAAGATLAATAAQAVKDADVLFKVRAPEAAEIAALKTGAIVAAALNPHVDKDSLNALAKAGASSLAMEFIPRITRAQVMDMLSSQANLAGYRAVIEASEAYGKALPMMMTAAGTIAAAKVFIMGVGVAGLQAIATARRLGAVVTATDVRPATKEQVESLGAKFLAVEDEEFKNAQTAGGYAKEMSAEYQAKQAELVSAHIAKQDIVITTALIPGRPAPKLVSAAQVASMRPGSIIVDLAIEAGGNVVGAKLGETAVTENGVKILGIPNLPGRIATDASALYARNLFALSGLFLNKEGSFAPDFEDEILKAALVTRGGEVVHPALKTA